MSVTAYLGLQSHCRAVGVVLPLHYARMQRHSRLKDITVQAVALREIMRFLIHVSGNTRAVVFDLPREDALRLDHDTLLDLCRVALNCGVYEEFTMETL